MSLFNKKRRSSSQIQKIFLVLERLISQFEQNKKWGYLEEIFKPYNFFVIYNSCLCYFLKIKLKTLFHSSELEFLNSRNSKIPREIREPKIISVLNLNLNWKILTDPMYQKFESLFLTFFENLSTSPFGFQESSGDFELDERHSFFITESLVSTRSVIKSFYPKLAQIKKKFKLFTG